MAKARKLSSGRWQCEGFGGRDINGKRIRKAFTADTKKEAEYLATQYTMEEHSNSSVITFQKAADGYLTVKESVLAPSTIRSYKGLLKNNYGHIKQMDIERIKAADAQQCIADMVEKGNSPKTIRNAVGFMTAVFGMYRPEFHPQIKLPQKKKFKPYTPSDDDIKALLEEVKGTELEIAILLAAFGPLRRGEICALTSDDCDFDKNTITVNKALSLSENNEWVLKDPKTYESNRTIEMPVKVMERIQGIDGRIVSMTPSAVSGRFVRALAHVGVPRFRFHDLRHYAASILHAIGVPDKYIMHRGGWSSDYTLKHIYEGVISAEEKKNTAKILEHFDGIM